MSAFVPRFAISNATAASLTLIERARGFLEAAKLSSEWVARMSQRALLLEAHATTHIEGTELTFEQAERLWAGQPVAEAKPDDVRELLNYREAFGLVSEYLATGEPVTEGMIREIHRRLVHGVRGGEGAPGSYRTVQNFVVNSVTREIVYTPPPPGDVAPLMRELVEWLRAGSDIHPVLVAGLAQFQLVNVHPFVDGNGRTSRLLSTLCLYRAGYDFKRLFTLSEFYDRDRSRFYRALQGVRESGMDLTGWLDYFTEGLATQLGEVKARGEVVIRADLASREHRLNSRQGAVLEEILLKGGATLAEVEGRFQGVSRRTIQRDLRLLIGRGLLDEEGTGPTDPNRRYLRGKALKSYDKL